MVPNAGNQIEFEITGDARIVGVDNGNPVSHESMKGKTIKAFNGKCLVIVQAGENVGSVALIAKSKELKNGEVKIQLKK